MKRLFAVVVMTILFALLNFSFKPIPAPVDNIVAAPAFSYARFMQLLWLKPVAATRAPFYGDKEGGLRGYACGKQGVYQCCDRSTKTSA
jgi:hypothetical protein